MKKIETKEFRIVSSWEFGTIVLNKKTGNIEKHEKNLRLREYNGEEEVLKNSLEICWFQKTKDEYVVCEDYLTVNDIIRKIQEITKDSEWLDFIYNKVFEEKQQQVIEKLEEAEYRLQEALDKISSLRQEAETAENASELWESLTDGTLEDLPGELEYIADITKEAWRTADDELEEEARNSEEEEEEEENEE